MMQLLESTKTHKKGRSAGGTIFSIILHSLIVFLAVFATARAGTKIKENRATKVNFVAVKEPPPPPKKEVPKPEPPKPKKEPTPPKVVSVPLPKVVAPAPPQGFKVLPPPVNIPTN